MSAPRRSPKNKSKSPHNWFIRLLLFVMVIVAFAALCYLAAVEMTWPQQAVLALALMSLSFWLDRSSKSHVITLTMMGMSLFATCRYGYWRLHLVARFFGDTRSRWGWLDAFFILMLVSAEVYAFVILVLGYIQTVWPLHRPPAPLPDDPAEWPEVDLLIPSYNEPLSVVRYTALAALNIDWPPEKLHVYILDDGKRDEFRAFAEAANVGYLTRTGNEGAKAGNINRALEKTHSPFVTIFDCDHVPTRSFLQITVGWFLRDASLGMLQTPHHFYSPDPFERNLGKFRTIPNEGELFYGIVQDGNDFWNASFFCGSCAVLRRTAIMEVGGIATETVTEDAHTSLKIQKNGWSTAYINLPQAAGLATESLSGHVSQRVRWARGMIQILRTDNPLLAKGLNLAQRLCYFNAMMHFMYALPRLIFLTAPLLYLIFSRSNVPGYWAAILAFALPHLVLSSATNSRIQGMHRHSFWNEIYETVLAPYILAPTLMALFNPKLGTFNVTAKGGVVADVYFDRTIARPFVGLLALNALGLLMAVPRLVHLPYLEWLWDGAHPGTVIMNCVWTVFNVVIISVATAVARESQQRRGQVRISIASRISVLLPDGQVVPGDTSDLSSSGACVQLLEPVELAIGQETQMVFALRSGNAALPVIVRGNNDTELRLQFSPLSMEQQVLLTEALYSGADTWLKYDHGREPDKPLRSLATILRLSLSGMAIALGSLLPVREAGKRKQPELGTSHVGAICLALLLPGIGLFAGRHADAASLPRPAAAASVAIPARRPAAGLSVAGHAISLHPAGFHDQFTLSDVGLLAPIGLRGRYSARSVAFSLPATELAEQASLHVAYRLPTSQARPSTALRVLLNGAEIAVLTAPAGSAKNALLEQEVTLPAELLVQKNQITFALPGDGPSTCSATALQPEGTIEPQTRIVLSGQLMAMADDLARLPLPFLDPASVRLGRLPVVFMSTPSPAALQAAGIVASYFGMLAGDHPVLFPVSIGPLPRGNVILFATQADQLPAGVAPSGQGMIAIRPNPADPSSKVLVVTGTTDEQLVRAAQALALQGLETRADHAAEQPATQGATLSAEKSADERAPLRKSFTGDTAVIGALELPPPRQPDDAPRWARTSQPIPLFDAAGGETAGDGSVPVDVYLRLPPDLAYLNLDTVPLTLAYRYNQTPIQSGSAAQVVVNGQYAGATLLPPGRSAAKDIRGRMALATTALRPFSNSLEMSFAFLYAHAGACQEVTPAGMTAALQNTSALDLRDVPHWATLPDLELMANAGFPFTRYADLGQTTVVLAAQPSSSEIAAFLMLMGHFGAQTGYPALRLQVESSSALQPGSDRDFLVLGSLNDQAAIAGLAALLPIAFEGSGFAIQPPERPFAALQKAWDKLPGLMRGPAKVDVGPLRFASMPDALLAGMESPYKAGRTLVLVIMPAAGSVPNADALAGPSPGADASAAPGKEPAWLAHFLRVAQSSAISGSLSVAQDGHIYAYHMPGNSYHLGHLPPRLQVDLWLTEAPWSVPGGVLACCLPLAFCTRGWLVRRAADRLKGVQQ